MKASWDSTRHTYATENVTEALDELSNLSIPAGRTRIDYVVLSDTMKRGVALEQWEPAKAMSQRAVDKFYASDAFSVVYREADTTIFKIEWARFEVSPT